MAIYKEDGTVVLEKAEYESLLDSSMRYNSLRNGGVDNWEWYWEALAEYREWAGEEE